MHICHWLCREGSLPRYDPKPGNLPYAGTGAAAPDHEALVVPLFLQVQEVDLKIR